MPRASETQKAERLNRARELLRHVDLALAKAVRDPNDSAREDALIGLVGIRRGLFPDAPAYRPRAGESVAA